MALVDFSDGFAAVDVALVVVAAALGAFPGFGAFVVAAFFDDDFVLTVISSSSSSALSSSSSSSSLPLVAAAAASSPSSSSLAIFLLLCLRSIFSAFLDGAAAGFFSLTAGLSSWSSASSSVFVLSVSLAALLVFARQHAKPYADQATNALRDYKTHLFAAGRLVFVGVSVRRCRRRCRRCRRARRRLLRLARRRRSGWRL